MPLVLKTANRNVGRRAGPVRREDFFTVAGPTTSACPVSISGSGSVGISGESDLRESINALGTFGKSVGYGREAKIAIFATAFLEMQTYPLDDESAFVMIKRVSPIMPSPLPLDSRRRPT